MDGNVFLLNGSHDYNDDPDELSHKNMNKKKKVSQNWFCFQPTENWFSFYAREMCHFSDEC